MNSPALKDRSYSKKRHKPHFQCSVPNDVGTSHPLQCLSVLYSKCAVYLYIKTSKRAIYLYIKSSKCAVYLYIKSSKCAVYLYITSSGIFTSRPVNVISLHHVQWYIYIKTSKCYIFTSRPINVLYIFTSSPVKLMLLLTQAVWRLQCVYWEEYSLCKVLVIIEHWSHHFH